MPRSAFRGSSQEKSRLVKRIRSDSFNSFNSQFPISFQAYPRVTTDPAPKTVALSRRSTTMPRYILYVTPRLRIRSLAAIAAALFAGCAAVRRAPVAPATALRVMTYNIKSGNGNLAGTADAIRAESPDIVALQEVDVHWADRSAFADQATELGARLRMNVRFARIYD